MTYSPNKRKLVDPEVPNGVYNRPYIPLEPITINRNTHGYSPLSPTLLPPTPIVPIYTPFTNIPQIL